MTALERYEVKQKHMLQIYHKIAVRLAYIIYIEEAIAAVNTKYIVIITPT